MNDKNFDTKIIVLELDFSVIKDYDSDIFCIVKNLLFILSSSQHLVLMTDNSLFDSITIIKKLNIRVGYLVCNSGAITYNIATKQIMSEKKLHTDNIIIPIKYAFFQNLPFILHTKKNKSYLYNWNDWIFSKFLQQGRRFDIKNKRIIKDWGGIAAAMKEHIYSLEIHFFQKKKSDIKKHEEHLKNIRGQTYYNQGQDRLRSFQDLQQIIGIKGDNVLYFAIHQFTWDMVDYSYFAIASNQTSKKHPKLYKSGYVGERWFNFFQENQYLWNGNPQEMIKNLFKKVKYLNKNNNEGPIKQLYINTVNSTAYKENNIENKNNTMYLFWPDSQKLLDKILKNKTIIS